MENPINRPTIRQTLRIGLATLWVLWMALEPRLASATPLQRCIQTNFEEFDHNSHDEPSLPIDQTLVDKKADPNRLLSVIRDAITLQKSHFKKYDEVRDPTNGFLLGRLNESEILNIIENDRGRILATYEKGQMTGYILLTSGDDFLGKSEFVADPGLEPSPDFRNKVKNADYIWTIAVQQQSNGRGIGSKLIEEAKKQSPGGLTAEIFAYPESIDNQASFNTFLKNSFRKIGELHYGPNHTVPISHRKRVMFWEPE